MSKEQSPFQIYRPSVNQLIPIIISVPHSGTEFPDEIKSQFHPGIIQHPQDTDWYVDKLYHFALEMGITIIRARYSRYVIDLNRDPKDEPLYQDDRHITSLVPVTTFNQMPLYHDTQPTLEDITYRLNHYYWPYYNAITQLLAELKTQFANVMLFDAHSIKRFVPSICPQSFPSLILGNQNHKTAASSLVQCGLISLSQDSLYDVSDNQPFMGGHITRYFAKPDIGIHTLQLEMSQDIYMDEETTQYHDLKAKRVQTVLKALFHNLSQVLGELS